jgi:hypothetical protein
MVQEPKFEKVYLVTNVRLEAKDLMAIELLDETSTPQTGMVKRAIFYMAANDDYLGLLQGPVPSKRVKVTITPA